MNNLQKYFINLINDHISFSDNIFICVKNFKIDKSGKIYWDSEDMPSLNARKVSIVGVSFSDVSVFDYFNVSDTDVQTKRSHAFQYPWSRWGSYVFYLNHVKDGPICSFLENVFLQMLHEVERGHNVFLGSELFMEKSSSYEHMMKIDLLDVE